MTTMVLKHDYFSTAEINKCIPIVETFISTVKIDSIIGQELSIKLTYYALETH